jgi:type IV secretory pathway component VirB8
MTIEYELEQHLNDANDRVELYREELIKHDVCNNDIDELLELCVESNYQQIHDILLTNNYSEYNQWIKNNIDKNKSYCQWLKKVKKDEDEEYLRRYQRIMKRV